MPASKWMRLNKSFQKRRAKKPLIWFWTHGEQELERFLKDLNNFTLDLSFTHKASKNCIPFLDLQVKPIDGELETNL